MIAKFLCLLKENEKTPGRRVHSPCPCRNPVHDSGAKTAAPAVSIAFDDVTTTTTVTVTMADDREARGGGGGGGGGRGGGGGGGCGGGGGGGGALSGLMRKKIKHRTRT